jgi:hypothetical protein
MVFGKDGFFEGSEMALRKGLNLPSIEYWYFDQKSFGMGHFNKGKFLYSMTTNQDITSISANCEKF